VLVDAIDDVQVEEDSDPIILADLDDIFMDIDSDLSFTYSNDNESLVTVTIDGDNAVTLTLTEDVNGTSNLTFTADDGELTVTDEVLVTVTPTNDPPEITGQDELSTPEETPLTITLGDLSVEDIDNTYPDDFTLTVLEGDNYTIEGGSGGGNDNSETNPFEGLVISNSSSGAFLAQATIDGTPAGEGDWSAAFDEDGNIAASIGKKSFSDIKIIENFNAFIQTIQKEKPSKIKGDFILSSFLTSTMGISYKLKLRA